MKSSKMWLGLLVVCNLAAGAVAAAPHHRTARKSGVDATDIGMPSATGRLNLLAVVNNLPEENIASKVFGQSGGIPTPATGPRSTGSLYLVVDMSGGLEAAHWPVSYLSAVPEGGWQYEHKTSKLVLRRVEAGSFAMGSPSWEFGRSDDEIQHKVVLTDPYYVGVFEFTQQQWMRVMSYNPSEHSGTARPVEEVEYEEIRGTDVGRGWPGHFDVDDAAFLGILRLKTGLAFDLPTEAQWEYACRAGTTSALNTGKDLTAEDKCPNVAEAGRYFYNQTNGVGGFTNAHTIVGSYPPNAWGLYDMHGNVEEWCLDWYGEYPSTTVTNPLGGTAPTVRITRGGCWQMDAFGCRSAYRHAYHPDECVGFRLVCPVISSQKQLVTFDANGGTCGTPTQTNTILGVYETLPSDVSRAGYIFDGWFSDPTGGHRVYVSSMVTTNTTRTLYAHWHPDIQVVAFDPNGGQCNRTTDSYTVDTTYTPLPAATRAGYIFDGWFSAASGGTLVTTTNTVTTDLSRTLYAHWTPDKQTVTFDPRGGTCATQTATYTVDSTYSPLPVPVLEHYRFDGWFADPWYAQAITTDSIVTTDPERTFYAYWTRVEQVVTFDPNGGACDTETQIQTIGLPYADLPTATLEHYALAGWFIERDGGDRVDGSIVPAIDTLTLYAHWTLVEHVVTFDPNGGICPETNRTYTVGQPYASFPTPTLEHYAAEWYTTSSGGEPVTPDTIVPAVEYQTLYAQWTRVDQIVSFNPNGGSCDTDCRIYTIGKPYAFLPEATLEKHRFEGWYTHWNEGNRVDITNIVSAIDTLNLYAQWSQFQVVTFEANGGSCDTETKEYRVGKIYGWLPLPQPPGEEYAFNGWITEQGERIGESTEVSSTEPLHLIAQWIKYAILPNDSVAILGVEPANGSLVLPESVAGYLLARIEAKAFYGCSGLRSVTIPDCVTSIGRLAFESCSETLFDDSCIPGVRLLDGWAIRDTASLPSVLDLTGIHGIADNAFDYCRNLTSVRIPNSVTNIGKYAFDYCSGLTNVTIGNGVVNIGIRAFSACSNLTSLIIPDSVMSIGNYAFQNCSGLATVTIPNSVTSIGDGAFSSCDALKEFHVETANPSYVAVDGVLFSKDGQLVCFPCGKTVSHYAIPYGVTSILRVAFSRCSSLTSVTIPNSVTSIGDRAFAYCSGLTSVTIGNGVTSIGDMAFDGCRNLTNVTIPDSVTSIGDYAFANCSSLTSLSVPGSWERTDKLENAGIPEGCTIVYRSIPGTHTTPVSVPFSWLEQDAADILAAKGGDHEAAATAIATNGLPVWKCYIAGLSPTNAVEFKVKSITFVDGEPQVEWDPDLNENGTKTNRTYRVEGTPTLTNEWTTPAAPDSRFFRVWVGMAE